MPIMKHGNAPPPAPAYLYLQRANGQSHAQGDFYRPPRENVCQPPTAYDRAVEEAPTVNGVETHFKRFFGSGEVSALPGWTRSHWTADTQGPRPKRDLRALAFKEVQTPHPAPPRAHVFF